MKALCPEHGLTPSSFILHPSSFMLSCGLSVLHFHAVQSPALMAKKFYISTAIHYVNDLPHIGHMYENVVADVIARHRRRMGDDVWFLTGTDEHGQKIERAAAKEGILPIELADRVVAKHHELWRKLDISYDDFIRTTENRHRVGVL